MNMLALVANQIVQCEPWGDGPDPAARHQDKQFTPTPYQRSRIIVGVLRQIHTQHMRRREPVPLYMNNKTGALSASFETDSRRLKGQILLGLFLPDINFDDLEEIWDAAKTEFFGDQDE